MEIITISCYLLNHQIISDDLLNYLTFFLDIKDIFNFLKTSKTVKQTIHLRWNKFLMRDLCHDIKSKKISAQLLYQLLYLSSKVNDQEIIKIVKYSDYELNSENIFGDSILILASKKGYEQMV